PVQGARVRRVRRGAIFLVAGDRAPSLYLVRRGQVRTFVVSGARRETTTAVLGPGHVVGIAALLGRATHHAFAQALTPVELWVLPADRLFATLADDGTLGAAVAAALTRQLGLAEGLLGDVALLPVAERVGNALRLVARCLGDEPPRFTRAALATLVGAARESVSRAASRSPVLVARP